MALPKPHSGQQRILKLAGRYRVAVCGRRFGKSVVGAITCVTHAEKSKNQTIWWLMPSMPQAERMERKVARWLREKLDKKAKSKLKWKWKKTQHILECSNGSIIEFVSAEVGEDLRGEGLDLLVIDETADVEEWIWKTVLQPMLLTTHGEVLFLGTPRGKNNWMSTLFNRGQVPGQTKWASIQMPTRENPLIDLAEIEALRSEMTEQEFSQEILAEFVEGVNEVFTNIEACTYTTTPEIARGNWLTKKHCGIDLARKQDYSVIVTGSGQTVIAIDRFGRMMWRDQLTRIQKTLNEWTADANCDATGVGDVIYEQLMLAGNRVFPFIINKIRRTDLINNLALAFQKKQIGIPNHEILIRELKSFAYCEDDRGNFIPAAPKNQHDDCVLALALFWNLTDRKKPLEWNNTHTYDKFGNVVAIQPKGIFA